MTIKMCTNALAVYKSYSNTKETNYGLIMRGKNYYK